MSFSSSSINQLLEEQVKTWELARINYQALNSIQSKSFDMGGFTIRVQFNPARIVSSAAKVDKQSIQERKCFLCPENLPKEQNDRPFNEEYHALVNPFPIFNKHFTLPTYAHTDQVIYTKIDTMLAMARNLTEHTLFYNGPKSGASAPDHAHFQAGERGFMPIEREIDAFCGEKLIDTPYTQIYPIVNYLRNGIYICSQNREEAVTWFKQAYQLLEIKKEDPEPMMNVITWFKDPEWHCCIFPRNVHRPACYFAEGEENILLSPASVDLGGVFITPLEKDFLKITADDIRQILKEVCMKEDAFETWIEQIKAISLN